MMVSEDTEMDRLAGLINVEIGRKHSRPVCLKCNRPQSVCWCVSVTRLPEVRCSVVILQHPHEEKRCLRTAPMLEYALPRCRVIKGKKFNSSTVPELKDPRAVLVFPGPDAVDVAALKPLQKLPQPKSLLGQEQTPEKHQKEIRSLETLQNGHNSTETQPDKLKQLTNSDDCCVEMPYTIVVLDGTWHQARAIMHNNLDLRKMKKVIVKSSVVSKYVIRTQPTDNALSTVESVALALSLLEQNDTIYSTLVQPLETLCHHQLRHGAVIHHSKERRLFGSNIDDTNSTDVSSDGDTHKERTVVVGKRTAKTLMACGATRSVTPGRDQPGSTSYDKNNELCSAENDESSFAGNIEAHHEDIESQEHESSDKNDLRCYHSVDNYRNNMSGPSNCMFECTDLNSSPKYLNGIEPNKDSSPID